MEAVRAALLQVLEEHPDIAPGRASECFHIQNATTHAASVLRLQAAGRQLLILPLLALRVHARSTCVLKILHDDLANVLVL